ncbi:pentatricopeptide repeat-containing protein [Tripterygium wilfordii]|uniref:Pentatricopeptide repeat-containing protein n=1 Tax=Tripterygium wilfordii TaxID=458696 RepID=A0A7J7E2Y3_TRIWF|nr:pentatricopeptide repeat-containing protein At5g66631 [Tripterygium wilfordii]KAF5752947.1 pentatricopeptide repeat-containing protein [Tripterygium wilfordii]
MHCIKYAVAIFKHPIQGSKATQIHFTILTQQARTFVRPPFSNRVTHYLHRAKLIDSIRLALRSSSPNSLPSLLSNTRLLDSFVVTQALRSAPSAESALSLVEYLKETVPHFAHRQDSLRALATVLAKHRRCAELNSLIGEIEAGRFGNVRISSMNLMTWYATAGDIDEVLNVWSEYRRNEKGVCTESYNLVMRLYVQRGRDAEAVHVFCEMIDEGAIPNSRTYFVMVEHLVSRGKLDAALEVFKVLPLMRIKRTSKMYLVLVEGFVGAGRFDEVKLLLNEMWVDGMFPGRAMLVALQQMPEAGLLGEVEEFCREMMPDKRIKSIGDCGESSEDDDDEEDDHGCSEKHVDGVKLKPWLDPRALANALKHWSPEEVSALEDAKFVWTTRLVCKILRNFKSPETAWNFFCWVACQPGFDHDIYTVQRMISLLARHGIVELVENLLDKVRREGMRLPFSTIRLIIDFYGISKNADAALKVFHNERTLCGPLSKFNLMLLYSSLLRTLTKCRRGTDVLDILDEMILSGTCPDIQTLSGLMYHFATQGDIKTVQRLFAMVRQSGLEPDAYTYKILIQAYCKCERAALAWRVFEDMRNSNLRPDFATKELLVKCLWNEGKRKEAAAVEEICEDLTNVVPLAVRGHIWTVCSADLARVYDIYSSSFT